MLKITNYRPLCPTITIDTNEVNVGHGFMTQLGFDVDSYKIQVVNASLDGALPSARSRSVLVNEMSEIAGQLQVQFLDDGKVVGIDGFSQRDCVTLFRLIYGWMNFSVTHLNLKERVTRRILHR